MSQRQRIIKDFKTKQDIVDLIRSACSNAGSQKSFAYANGLSIAYINDILQHRRAPGKSILDVLGYERRVIYLKKNA